MIDSIDCSMKGLTFVIALHLQFFQKLLLSILQISTISVVFFSDINDLLLDTLQLGEQLSQFSSLGFHFGLQGGVSLFQPCCFLRCYLASDMVPFSLPISKPFSLNKASNRWQQCLPQSRYPSRVVYTKGGSLYNRQKKDDGS